MAVYHITPPIAQERIYGHPVRDGKNHRQPSGPQKLESSTSIGFILEEFPSLSIESWLVNTVDGKNPAPPGMYETLQLMG